MFKMKTALLGLVLVGMVGLLSGQASAGIIVYSLNYVFSGDTPSGPAPWVQAVFEDIGTNQVKLTLIGHLGSQFIGDKGWYFNFDDNLDLAALSFNTTNAPGATIERDKDNLKPDGDGLFDWRIMWSNPKQRFDDSDINTIIISSTENITVSSFNFRSEQAGGNPKYGYYSAAHIQNIPGKGSGWIADQDGPGGLQEIPEASPLVLWGFGCLGLVLLEWNRRRK